MANEIDIGAGRVRLAVDASDWDTALARAKNAAVGFGNDAQAAFDSTQGSVRNASARLLDYMATIARTGDEVRTLDRITKASRAGVPDEIIQAAIKRQQEYQAELRDTAAAQQALADSAAAEASAARLAAAWAEGAREANELTQAERRLAAEQLETYNRTQDQIEAERQRAALIQSLSRQDDSYTASQAAAAEQAAAEERIAAARREGIQLSNDELQAERLLQKEQLETYNRTQDQIEAERQRAALIQSLSRQGAEYEAAEAQRLQVSKGQQEYLQYLRNLSDTAGKTHYEILELKAAQLGLSEQAAPMIASLKAQSQQMGMGTLSAKQYQAALRGVPAQITDIFVSLQGGQAPLTVLLQQGGQLKDMFGGVGSAARALGAELLKVATNPYVLATAAVAGLSYAMYQADDISDEFALSIAKSGNYAETTTQQLSRMADQLAKTGNVSFSTSAEALAAAVATGQIGSENLLKISTAAAEAQVVLGDKIEDTIKTYIKLGETPLTTLLDLNKTENFLTAAQIERIAALEDEGDMQQAANEAIALYIQHQQEMTDKVREAYSPAKSFWEDLKTWVDDATVSIGNAGLATADVIAQLATGSRADGSSIFDLSNLANGANTSEGRALADLATRSAEARADAEARASSSQAEAAKQAAKTVEFERETTKLKQGQLTTEQKIAQMTERAQKAGIDATRIQARADAIRAADAKKPKTKGDGGLANSEASAALQALKDQLAQEQAAISTSQKALDNQYKLRSISAEAYYSDMRTLVQQDTDAQVSAIQKQIDYLEQRSVKGKDAANVQKQIGQLEAQLVSVREKSAQRLNDLDTQQAQALQQRQQAERAYAQALTATEEALVRQMAATAQRVGMGDRQYEIESKINSVYEKQADELRNIATQLENKQITEGEAETKRTTLYASTARQIEIIKQGYEDLAKAEGSWFDGFNSAWENFKTSVGDQASVAKDAWTTAFDTIGNAAAQTAKGVSVDWDGMVESMLASLAKLGTNAILNSVIGYFSGSATLTNTSNITTSMQGINASLATPNALGGVYQSPSLSAYSNSIVSQPTFFAFAKGGALGVAGEAGAEAIVPLAKDSNGELGVKAKGASGDGVQIEVNVYGAEQGATATATQDSSTGLFTIDVIVGQVEAKMAGNVLNGTSKLDTAMRKKYQLRTA